MYRHQYNNDYDDEEETFFNDREIHKLPYPKSMKQFNDNNLATYYIENALSHRQSPYWFQSWTKMGDLYYDSLYPSQSDKAHQDRIFEQFHNRYAIVKEIIHEGRTSTRPKIYQIQSRKINEIRFPFVMKVCSLKRRITSNKEKEESMEGGEEEEEEEDTFTKERLCEIYHEVVIGYFLNKLIYGFSSIFTIHFMLVFDWFTFRGNTLFKNNPLHYDKGLYHAIIVERAQTALSDYISSYPYIKILKAILFELFYSLEIAWYTFEFIHHDLHLSNVMLTPIKEESTLFNRNFTYKRLFRTSTAIETRWYMIDKSHINNHLVKIIDFGRSRMRVPSSKHNANKHHNSIMVQIDDYECYGYSSYSNGVNRQIDVYMCLFSLFRKTSQFWRLLESKNTKEEMNSFFQFCNDMIPFKEINDDIIDKNDEFCQERKLACKGKKDLFMDSYILTHCPKIRDHLLEEGVFVTKHHQNHTTNVTKALNHPFFDEYYQRDIEYMSHNENVLIANPSLMEFNDVIKKHSIEKKMIIPPSSKEETKKNDGDDDKQYESYDMTLNCMVCGKETEYVHRLCSNQCFKLKHGSCFVMI